MKRKRVVRRQQPAFLRHRGAIACAKCRFMSLRDRSVGASVITRRKGSESQRDGTEISREICWQQRARDELEACCAQVTSAPAPAEAAYMPVPWVFTDPKHDPFNPLTYITSNTLTAIAICEFSFLPPSPLFSSYVPRGRCEVGRSRATGAAPAGTLLTTTTTPAFLGAGAWRRWEAGSEAEVDPEVQG